MARKTDRPADKAWNAKRRFKRAAERYEKAAAKASPVEAARLRKQAEYMRSQADLMRKGADIPARTAKRIQASKLTLEGARKNKQKRRDIVARELMNTDVGAKIYGATVSIWQDSKYTDRDKALMDFFGVSDLMGVIEAFERQFGEDLYSDDEQPLIRPSEMLALRAILAFGL